MKAKDIISKTKSDLEKMLSEKREALRVFRFGTTGGKTKNVKTGMTLRKDIARILTVMHQKKD